MVGPLLIRQRLYTIMGKCGIGFLQNAKKRRHYLKINVIMMLPFFIHKCKFSNENNLIVLFS